MNKKILYMAGPGDIIGTYNWFRQGKDDPKQVAVAYSAQFFEACEQLNVHGIAISYQPKPAKLVDGRMIVQHIPVAFSNRRGMLFHLGWYLYSTKIALLALKHRCGVVVLMTGTHLTPYWLLKLFRIKVILSLHCTLWLKNKRPNTAWRFVHWLDRGFYSAGANSILSISSDIDKQVDELTQGKHAGTINFLPFYRAEGVSIGTIEPNVSRCFRVLFAGRVEENKGVFDLIEMSRLLRDQNGPEVIFDIAGDGSALSELKNRIRQANLEASFDLHGYCDADKMNSLLINCHAVIIPTKSSMIEGFNKVVAEAVLAKRPFITSNACPALDYVRGAGIEVPVDNIHAYVAAIARLALEPKFYDQLCKSAEMLGKQFYDQSTSWGCKLRGVLRQHGVGS